MHPIYFSGATEISKPSDMTDEQCYSLFATAGIDEAGFPYYMTCWLPSYDDLQAMNEGRPIMVKVLGKALPPMALFTLDREGNGNF